jgi:hypothetical protein
MICFDTEGNLIVKTSLDAESYAYTLKGLVHILDSTVSNLWDDGITPIMADAISNTFELLIDMLPNENQTPLLDDKTQRVQISTLIETKRDTATA